MGKHKLLSLDTHKYKTTFTLTTKIVLRFSTMTGSSGDVGKMFTSINKMFKTMGKAMSQVSEEIKAFNDKDSIGAQSRR